MNGIVINISWEYFLAFIGTIIALAYYANGRFTRVETSIEWLKDAVQGLRISVENSTAKLFDSGSPVTLTNAGRRALKRSGLQAYINSHKDELIARFCGPTRTDPYELQSRAFWFFSELPFDESFAEQLNEFAFATGLSTDLLRRVGAIYLRDIAVETV